MTIIARLGTETCLCMFINTFITEQHPPTPSLWRQVVLFNLVQLSFILGLWRG